MLALMEQRTPKLLDTLQTTLNNANDLTQTAKGSMQEISGAADRAQPDAANDHDDRRQPTSIS